MSTSSKRRLEVLQRQLIDSDSNKSSSNSISKQEELRNCKDLPLKSLESNPTSNESKSNGNVTIDNEWRLELIEDKEFSLHPIDFPLNAQNWFQIRLTQEAIDDFEEFIIQSQQLESKSKNSNSLFSSSTENNNNSQTTSERIKELQIALETIRSSFKQDSEKLNMMDTDVWLLFKAIGIDDSEQNPQAHSLYNVTRTISKILGKRPTKRSTPRLSKFLQIQVDRLIFRLQTFVSQLNSDQQRNLDQMIQESKSRWERVRSRLEISGLGGFNFAGFNTVSITFPLLPLLGFSSRGIGAKSFANTWVATYGGYRKRIL